MRKVATKKHLTLWIPYKTHERPVTVAQEQDAVTLQDWITSSGLHPDRTQSKDLTSKVVDFGKLWCDKVNTALNEMGWGGSRTLTSGFRPLVVNASTVGAASHSGHITGHAGDFKDEEGGMWDFVTNRPEILRKYGLFVEDRGATPGWCHIDYIQRADRPSRVFIP